jgi:hypothetical protein
MHKAWLLLIPLVMGGCQSTGSGSISVTVPVDQVRKVARYYSVHEDCASAGSSVVRITNQPAHGTVSVREGRDYPNYPATNPRNACNKRSVPASLVYYKPAPGYAGTDGLDVDAIYPGGQSRQDHINIVVK